MGTDIHMWVETKNWDGGWAMQLGEEATYGDRNYDVFAILADVRNGRGFAGVKTGDGFNVIAQPRGAPPDLSPEVARIWEKGIEHTPSWLLLSEVLSFDWTQTARLQGVVDGANFIIWENGEGRAPPNEWCGAVSGGATTMVDHEGMRRLIAQSAITPEAMRVILDPNSAWRTRREATPPPLRNTFTTVAWTQTYEQCASGFLGWARALTTGPHRLDRRKPEDVRLVFYFDS